MKSKILSQRLLFVVGITGIIFLVFGLSTSQASSVKPIIKSTKSVTIKKPTSKAVTSSVKQVTKKPVILAIKQVMLANPAVPIRFKIPALAIDTNVELVGLTKDGAMDSPIGPAPVGWFDLGPRPGDVGSAVIDGHSGWKNGIPAVFDNLYKLKIGDKIYVVDGKGATIPFVVRSFQTYKPNQDATNIFGSSDGGSHLNLITCSGVWDPVAKSHSNRLVVFADKVN